MEKKIFEVKIYRIDNGFIVINSKSKYTYTKTITQARKIALEELK